MALRLAANINWLFTEHEVENRVHLAAAAGFAGVECLFPYELDPAVLARTIRSAQVACALINAPAGDWAAGERGFAAVTDRHREFVSSVHRAIEVAQALGAERVHVMSGIADRHDRSARSTALRNLEWAADLGSSAGVVITIEPINHIDMPGYFLRTAEQARGILDEVGHPSLRLQLDLYHHAMEGGDVVAGLVEYAQVLEHVQIASAPGRHEPHLAGCPLDAIVEVLTQIEYSGWVGAEYSPHTDTASGLGWMEHFATE